MTATNEQQYLQSLMAFQREEVQLELEQAGYEINRLSGAAGDFSFLARKNGKTVAYLFRPAGNLHAGAKEIQTLRAKAHTLGYQFRLVILPRPKRPAIEIAGLEQALTDYVINVEPLTGLDALASAVFIDSISDIDVWKAEVSADSIEVSGQAALNLRLEYGGGDAADGSTSTDSIPIDFAVVLSHDLQIQHADVRPDLSSIALAS